MDSLRKQMKYTFKIEISGIVYETSGFEGAGNLTLFINLIRITVTLVFWSIPTCLVWVKPCKM